MEGVPIRAARRGDIPSLLLLWEQMMRENASLDDRLVPHPRAREYMQAQFSNWMQDDKHIVVVAEEGGRLVIGYAAGAVVGTTGWQAPIELGVMTAQPCSRETSRTLNRPPMFTR